MANVATWLCCNLAWPCLFFFQDDEEEPGQGPRNNTDLLVERLKRVHVEFMEKSNDYDKIHNEVVQSEQVGDVFLCRSCNMFKSSLSQRNSCSQKIAWLTLVSSLVWYVTSSNLFADSHDVKVELQNVQFIMQMGLWLKRRPVEAYSVMNYQWNFEQ